MSTSDHATLETTEVKALLGDFPRKIKILMSNFAFEFALAFYRIM